MSLPPHHSENAELIVKKDQKARALKQRTNLCFIYKTPTTKHVLVGFENGLKNNAMPPASLLHLNCHKNAKG